MVYVTVECTDYIRPYALFPGQSIADGLFTAPRLAAIEPCIAMGLLALYYFML
jgi:hypothetical protein